MRRALLATLLFALCLATPARAGESVFGSDLSAPADFAVSHGADTAYWNTGVTAPADGELVAIDVRGGVLPNQSAAKYQDLATLFHFQSLHPRPDGTMLIELSSGHMHLPLTGNPRQALTAYGQSSNPHGSDPLLNLCVHRGDVVALNHIGAHEYRRTPYDPAYQGAEVQVFASNQGSSRVHWYQADNGTNTGTVIDPRRGGDLPPGSELLMRTKLATGPDATDICPGGYKQHVFRGPKISRYETGIPTVLTKTNAGRVRIFCHGENYGACAGELRLDAALDGETARVATFPFRVENGETKRFDFPVAAAHVAALRRAGMVEGKVTMDAHDDPRADSRAQSSVPVQSKVVTTGFDLIPDDPLSGSAKPMCKVPNLKGRKPRSAAKLLRKAGCKLGKVRHRRTDRGALVGRVLSHRPTYKRVISARTGVRMSIGKR